MNSKTFPWHLLLYLILILISLPFITPIIWMFGSSLKSAQAIFGSPFGLNFDAGLKNFTEVFTKYPFAKQYLNSLLTLLFSVPLTMLFSATAGYAFARLRFPGRDMAFLMTLAAMMVPAELVAIPQFVAFKALGLSNTLFPIMLLQIFSATGALCVFLMRQHFITLPKELDEAGRIDGLSTFGIFRSIMLPLSKPALATVAIFSVLNSWNDYFNPLIYLNDESKMTLPLALQRFTDPLGGTYWNLTLAASVMVALPVLIVFLLAQRTFIESLAASGTKG